MPPPVKFNQIGMAWHSWYREALGFNESESHFHSPFLGVCVSLLCYQLLNLEGWSVYLGPSSEGQRQEKKGKMGI